MTKFLIDLYLDGYGDDQAGHDLACKEFIKDSLDFSASSVDIEEYPILTQVDPAEQMYMDAELRHATALLVMCMPLVEAMIGIGSSARVVLPNVREYLQHHGWVNHDTQDQQ